MNRGKTLQFSRGHYTEEQIALLAEALVEKRIHELPSRLTFHMEDCLQCKALIIEVSETISETRSQEIETANNQIQNFYIQTQGLSHGSKLEKEFEKHRVNQFPSAVIHLFSNISSMQKLAAIALVLIVTGTFLILFLPKRPDSQKLFAQNFAPYPDIISEKGMIASNDSSLQSFLTGINFYNQKKYDTALLIFDHLYRLNPDNDTIEFYYGNTILAANADPLIAIRIFSDIINKDTPLAEPSRWYLCLAYLKKNDLTHARRCLEDLKEKSEKFNQNAKYILKKIK